MSQAFETAIQRALREVVESFAEQYVAEGLLKKDAIIVDLDNYKPELVEKILTNAILNEAFTEDIAGVTILKINDIIQMLEVDEYWSNSYTRYTNKIGLSMNNRYLDEVTDVVLDFPYKDTILKAGMSKEDVSKEDATESFLNEIVAREEIDVLLDEKILKNAKKYDENGESDISEINDTDNLIIKGNNLLALHSLKKRFAGKVKCIFIDPPYNTGSDSFIYNDKFSRSTWLVFMKNRLKIAKELLKTDGTLWVQTDDSQHAYLKVLLDEIFGEGSYLNTVTIKSKSSSGASGGGEDRRLKKNTEFILIYANNDARINIQTKPYKLMNYIQERRENGKNFAYKTVLVNPGKLEKIGETVDGRGDCIELYQVKGYETKTIKSLMAEEGLDEGEIYKKYLDKIFTTENAQTSIRSRVRNNVTDDGYTIARYKPVSGKNKGKIVDVGFIGSTKRLVSFLKETAYIEDGEVYKTEKAGTLWEDISWSSIKTEGGVSLENGKKPEKLIHRIIASSSEESDIILDFFGGSGTTAAVAHKMNRQYITIEQMEYIDDLIVKRLENVVNGDSTGISKAIAWSGGGSFIYAELMDKNSTFIDIVLNSKNSEELKSIFDDMKSTLDFDFRVDLQEVAQSIWDEEFEMQKKILVKIIDKNQLYHNYSEIDDETIKSQLSQSDYDFNKSFYGEK